MNNSKPLNYLNYGHQGVRYFCIKFEIFKRKTSMTTVLLHSVLMSAPSQLSRAPQLCDKAAGLLSQLTHLCPCYAQCCVSSQFMRWSAVNASDFVAPQQSWHPVARVLRGTTKQEIAPRYGNKPNTLSNLFTNKLPILGAFNRDKFNSSRQRVHTGTYPELGKVPLL